MNVSEIKFMCSGGTRMLAIASSSPPTLVGLPDTPGAGSAVGFSTWPTLLVGAAVVAVLFFFAWRWLMILRTRSAGTAAALPLMCRGLKLTASDQRTLKALARSHGGVTAATLLLCPSALDLAAARADNEVDRFALTRLREKLA